MFQESLSTIKDDTSLMVQAAWAAYSVGHLDEAGKRMKTVTAQSKDAGELAAATKFLELQREDCPGETIAEVLVSDPEYVPALMARAARDMNKDQTAALEDYEKVLEVFPMFAPARIAIERIRSEKQAASTGWPVQ